MRQIGARQEAGRIGGIGPCGRELCCSTWMVNFVSVTTGSARDQELSLNPQKLAGQCGKLKCCLNYELECYLDARKDFPDVSLVLETEDGVLYHQKTDVYNRIMWYGPEKESALNMIPLPVDRVCDIIRMNRQGTRPKRLREETNMKTPVTSTGGNDLNNEDLSRFSGKSGNKARRHRPKRGRNENRKP